MSVAAKKHSGLKRKFTVQAAPGSEVYLAGCFTGWREREIPLKDDGNGNFEAEVELEPGVYQYKFIVNGNWSYYAGKITTLGLVSDSDPSANYVQIPLGSGTQWADGKFTEDDYKAMVKNMFDGKLDVSSDTKKNPSDFATVITVDDQGKIK